MKSLAGLTRLYKINNKEIDLSPKQQEIFNLIVGREHPRNQIIAPTQYGKSLTVALGVLTRSVFMGEKFVILAPSEKKAQIIMGYVINHAFDNRVITEQLELDPTENLDRLRRQRTRNHLTFRSGGGVMTLTLDARNSRRSIEAAMGFGGNRLILDESSLIDDPLYSTVKRMLGGYPYSDTFMLEIGNPFYRNHFHRTWHGDRYNKIFIDYKIGLEEGRYSPEFIEEMREEAFFDVFYECKFPDADYVDEKGYRPLITEEQIEECFITKLKKPGRELKLGADIGGGGDHNVYVMRDEKKAWIAGKNKSGDTMTNVTEIENLKKKYPMLQDENIFVDDIGVGRGVTDRLKEKGIEVNGVSVGEKPVDETRYKNIKAENLWNARLWLKNGGKLIKDQDFMQMAWIKYKVSTDKVVQIEPKQELKRRKGKSPDVADAFALTFTQSQMPSVRFV